MIAELGRRFPGRPLVAIGYSLGATVLVNLLARACPAPLKAAVVVSAPLQLASCADRVNQGFSRVYQNYLLRTMRTNLQSKIRRQSAARARWQPAQITRIATLREFDELVTAPLHGFESADHYYQTCSGLGMLARIPIPTLVIHAADDPFMTDAVIPAAEQLSPLVRYELSRQGGHVGFLHGSPWAPRFWLDEHQPVVAGTDSGREPVTVAPLFLGLIEGAIDPLEQHDEALPGSPLGYPLAQGEVGKRRNPHGAEPWPPEWRECAPPPPGHRPASSPAAAPRTPLPVARHQIAGLPHTLLQALGHQDQALIPA